MSSEFEATEDEPLTPEEEAELAAQHREIELAWEAEATATFGPPELRARKNRRYATRLVRRHSESTIRGILKALATLDDPMCCQNLRDSEPLDIVIQPFAPLGFHFRIFNASENQFTVDIGESYGTVGSGGEFVLERLDDGSFRVVDVLSQWIS